jgi:hypothetical protein
MRAYLCILVFVICSNHAIFVLGFNIQQLLYEMERLQGLVQQQERKIKELESKASNSNELAIMNILGTSPDDSRDFITHRYKELSKMWHPDKCAKFNSCTEERKSMYQEKMIELNDAYQESLKSMGTRSRRRGKRGRGWEIGEWFGMKDIGDKIWSFLYEKIKDMGMDIRIYKILQFSIIFYIFQKLFKTIWSSDDSDSASANATANATATNENNKENEYKHEQYVYKTDEEILNTLFKKKTIEECKRYLVNYGDVFAAIDALIYSSRSSHSHSHTTNDDDSDDSSISIDINTLRLQKRQEAKVYLRRRKMKQQ